VAPDRPDTCRTTGGTAAIAGRRTGGQLNHRQTILILVKDPRKARNSRCVLGAGRKRTK